MQEILTVSRGYFGQILINRVIPVEVMERDVLELIFNYSLHSEGVSSTIDHTVVWVQTFLNVTEPNNQQ